MVACSDELRDGGTMESCMGHPYDLARSGTTGVDYEVVAMCDGRWATTGWFARVLVPPNDDLS
ncbi:MAG TPA: hypothetical protein VHC44_07095 [Verrucomicrobiae bacterium]|nr:hypothetical protein [Verrucomicrobiae bacterium]